MRTIRARFKRPLKYRNKPVEIDGIKFQSGKEGRRYQNLLLQEKAGMIQYFKVHPRFKLFVNHILVCTYIADFQYQRDGQWIVEDTKGIDPRTGWDTRTDVYKLKKKLMRVVLGIEVNEV